jgi:cobalt/nickel transport system ATP-binding protein
MPIIHPPKTQEYTLAQTIHVGGELLSIKQLSYCYPDGHQALDEITLQIHQGEKVALVGPNGAGKSTLMLHLNGIIQSQGEIHVAGLTVEKTNLPTIRAKVGLVFQNPDDQLFSPTVFEDVAFGPLHMGLPEDTVYTNVKHALAQVGMSEYDQRLSHHLSVGEKKRISIATVLAEMSITMLISTHDMGLVAELLPRMIIMDQGLIVADGLTKTLLADQFLLEQHGLERT